MCWRQKGLNVLLNAEQFVPHQISNRSEPEDEDADRPKPVPDRDRLTDAHTRALVMANHIEHPHGRGGETAVQHAVPWREKRFWFLMTMGPTIKEESDHHPHAADPRHQIIA